MLALPFATLFTLFVSSIPLHAVDTWNGNADPDNNWMTPANWVSGMAPLANADLHFQGSHQTTNNNDYSPGLGIASLTFDSNAAAFTLQGNPIIFFNNFSNTITNNSTNTQTLSFTGNGGYGGITSANDQTDVTIDAAAGNINVTCDIQLRKFLIATGGNLIVTGAHNTTISNIIDDSVARSAGITKNGSGILELDSPNNYRGGTTINNGTLIVGEFNALGIPEPNPFAISFNDVNLTGGRLQTSSPMTYNVPDNYVQTGGTVQFRIGGLTEGVNADLMQVGANGNLTTGNTKDAFLSSNVFFHRDNNFMPALGDRVTILSTQHGTVMGTWSGVSSDFPGLIQPTPDYFSDHVDAVFNLGSFTSVSGLTFNQNAVAVALNQAFADMCLPTSTFTILGAVPMADLPHVYDLIAPEEFAAMYEMSFSRATVQSANLQGRMDQIRANADPDCGPIVEINPVPEGKNVVGKNVVAPAPAPAPDNRWGTFAMGSGDYVTVHNQDENADGYKITNGSFLAGVDYRLLHNLAIGVYGGYVGSESDLAGHGRIISDGGTVGGYATFFSHGFYLQAAGGGGWNSYENLRAAFLGGAHSSTDGSEVNGMGALGYDWTMNFNAANHPGSLTVGPIASVQYTNVNIDGFHETGSLIPLEFPGQSEDSLRSTIGGKVAICLQTDHGIMLRPEARVAWLHEYNDRAYPIEARFIGCDDLFTVHGPRIGEDAAQVTAGLTVQFNPMVALFAHYEGLFGRNNYDSNGVSGGLALSF